MMGSDKGDDVDDHEPTTYTPTKLSLLISRPTSNTLTPEKPTPTPQNTVSIPFQWEEAPGKPRHCHTQSEPKNIARTLELPPRLLVFSEAKVSSKINMNLPSPTTVLDGPYVGRAMSFTSSHRTPRDHRNLNFGSTRWSGFGNSEGSFDFSGFTSTCSHGNPKVNITRVPQRGRSHFWASIYESFKQVVPWRRSGQKQRKWAYYSKIDSV